MRPRISKPQLVRSSDHTTNSKIVRKSKRRHKRTKNTRTSGTLIRDAYGVKGRTIYIGT